MTPVVKRKPHPSIYMGVVFHVLVGTTLHFIDEEDDDTIVIKEI
jgi:hypothetical protein